MLCLIFFVPASHAEDVKKAIFSAGAGQVGSYSECCWQVLGQGQFRPQSGSEPALGDVGVLTTVDEYRVEILIEPAARDACEAALKLSHPYEVPIYYFIETR